MHAGFVVAGTGAEISQGQITAFEIEGSAGDGFAEFGRRILESRLNQRRIFFGRKIRVLVFIIDDPAFAFGYNLVAEFFGGNFVSPLAECTFGELLDVAFVDQGYRLEFEIERMLNRHAYQAFGGEDRNGLDADSGICAHLLFAALQHFLV